MHVIKILNYFNLLIFLNFIGEFFVILIMSVMAFKVQANIMRNAFRELRHGVTDRKDIIEPVHDIIKSRFKDISDDYTVYIYKTGMHISVNVTLPAKNEKIDFGVLNQAKDFINQNLLSEFESADISFSV